MPLVTIHYQHILSTVAWNMARVLPGIVASALTSDDLDGHLTPDDVEVDVEPMPNGMRTQYHLHIIIEANEYSDRRSNLDQRRERIINALRAKFGEGWRGHGFRARAFVWVRLMPGSFGEV